MLNCELCDLVKGDVKTKLHYQNDSLIVITCETDSLPMVVLKRHDMTISLAELTHILNITYTLFGGHVKLRINQMKIGDHLHWHILK